MNSSKAKIFIASPTESRMSKRANRHPKLAEFLVEAGHEVEYITGNFSHPYKTYYSPEEIEAYKKAESYKVTVLNLPAYKKNISARRVVCNILITMKYMIYLLRNAKRGDVLVLASRPVEMVFCAAILKITKGVFAVIDIRDVWPDAFFSSNKTLKLLFTIYCNFYLYLSIRRIDKFVHVAPSFQKWLKRYTSKTSSVFVPLGFDRQRWESIKPNNKCSGDTISLVCVSLLQRQIDVMPILKALVNRKNFTFTFIGDDGTGERFGEVKAFIREHKMDNVSMVGRLSPEDVVEHLKGQNIGVVPMISNSIPNKVFDCIAAYLPIIALGDNDTANFVMENDIGWAAPFDEEKVGELLDNLSADDIAQKTENIAKIRDKFARDNLFKSYIRLIESACR